MLLQLRNHHMIRNIDEFLPWEEEVCVELHDVAFRNGGIFEMRMPIIIMLG